MSALFIDCDAAPFLPNGWQVVEHRKNGQLEWDSKRVSLYLSEKQRKGRVNGYELRQELEGKPVLNACVLDYLLAHPDLIPESWKEKHTFFWGTIYRYSVGGLCVRCLGWHDYGWHWHYYWLGGDFSYDYGPAAVRASSS